LRRIVVLRIFYFNVLVIVASLVCPPMEPASADDKKEAGATPIAAKEAFAKLKTLKGAWDCKSEMKHHDETLKSESRVIYKLTGAGSALVETDFPDTGHEMVSVYHLDGDDLRMTHYCAAQNQPRFKLDREHSTLDKLVFVFDGGSNLNPDKDAYICGLTMNFEKDGRVVCNWDSKHEGKDAGTTVFQLSRPAK
jgi:hypothetical protein